MMTGNQLREQFDLKWGRWRKFIASHPLTGWWSGVALGVAIGALGVWVA